MGKNRLWKSAHSAFRLSYELRIRKKEICWWLGWGINWNKLEWKCWIFQLVSIPKLSLNFLETIFIPRISTISNHPPGNPDTLIPWSSEQKKIIYLKAFFRNPFKRGICWEKADRTAAGMPGKISSPPFPGKSRASFRFQRETPQSW